MKQEIDVALQLLSSYVQRCGSIKDELIDRFRNQLGKVLFERYQGHWYPDKPIKGQAYRSLEFHKENDFCDVTVAQVCRSLGFATSLLGIRHELTLWIDPFEVSIRLGNHVSPKENQQVIVARFDKDGNELLRYDLDAIFSQSHLPIVQTKRASPTNSPNTLPPPTIQQSMFRNDPLFTPPRALSPQAPVFQMPLSTSPINVPTKPHPLENSIEEGSPNETNHSQPERSDTPYSMNSTTSNESSDSGYCGYVESYPYYYKLNRLYKALALQKHSPNGHPMGKPSHQRRVPQAIYHQRQNNIPSSFSSSPPTPTPLNIDRLAPFYAEQAFLPIPMAATGSRKSKC